MEKRLLAHILCGSRGTLKHAAFLGAMVTFTQLSRYLLWGLPCCSCFAMWFPKRSPSGSEQFSGLSIVAMGGWMFYKRLRHARAHAHGHHHHHHGHDHHHHGHPHSHVPEKMSWAGLAVLGASGGLVPCESALVLLLGAIALGRTGFGLVLLAFFSLGLAVVLMAIGALVLYAKNLLPVKAEIRPFSAGFQWLRRQ